MQMMIVRPFKVSLERGIKNNEQWNRWDAGTFPAPTNIFFSASVPLAEMGVIRGREVPADRS